MGGVERRRLGALRARQRRDRRSQPRRVDHRARAVRPRRVAARGRARRLAAGARARRARRPAAVQLVADDPRARRCDTVGGTAESAHADEVEARARRRFDGQPGQRLRLEAARSCPGPAPGGRVSTDEGWRSGRWSTLHRLRTRRQGRDPRRRRGRDRVRARWCASRTARSSTTARSHRPGPRSASGATPSAAAAAATSRRARSARSSRRSRSSRGVTNRHPAAGGVDAESVDEARVRGPLMLRTRSRAVTAEDFEQLTREAAPEVARVRCLPAQTAEDAGHVTVCVVPAARDHQNGMLRFEDLLPERGDDGGDRRARSRTRGSSALGRARRTARVPGRHRRRPAAIGAEADPERVRAEARRGAAPLLRSAGRRAGRARVGRGAGRHSRARRTACCSEIRGVDFVEEVRVFGANPVTGERGEATTRLELAAEQSRLLLRAPGPGGHTMMCVPRPRRPLLTTRSLALTRSHSRSVFK